MSRVYGKIMRQQGVFGPGHDARGAGIELSQADRDKWDARYLGGAYENRTYPSTLLAHWASRLEAAGKVSATQRGIDVAPRAIDVACGSGRNTLFLARRGWRVDAVDISAVALGRLRAAADAEDLSVNCVERDLEPASDALDMLGNRRYDLVLLIRYVNMPLVESLLRALVPGGHLIAEMHLRTDEPVAGPRSPRFRVAPGELRRAGAALELLHYHEGLVTDPDGRTVAVAQLVGRRREPPLA